MSQRRAQRKKPTIKQEQPSGHNRKWILPTLLGSIALVVGAAAWIRGASTAPGLKAPPTSPNVLLITMDTTRADHLGCYGHSAGATPHIDQIAREGVLFEQCTSAAPSTLASHASMLTGLYPFVHGARDNVGYRFSEGNTSLAEILRDQGFVTGAFVSGAPLHRRSGIDQGFETFKDTEGKTTVIGGETCDRAIRWMRGHANDRLFAWVHFFDPHYPYQAPSDFISSASNADVREIAYMDFQIGRLTTELKRLGLYDNTIIVLVADHGEGLGEHREETHLYYLYNTTIHVPLIVRAANLVPENLRIAETVRTVDIAPTLLGLLGLPPLPIDQGTNLQPLLAGRKHGSGLPAYAETISGRLTLGASILRSLCVGKWKYIHSPQAELYDLASDPGELNNLARKFPDQTQTMRDRLHGLIAESPQIKDLRDDSAKLHAQDLARLESLGYLGGDPENRPTAAIELDLFEPLGPDPKDLAIEFSELNYAQHLLGEGDFRAAELAFRGLVDRFPDAIEMRKKLARAIFSQNRFADAIKIYEALAAKHPNNIGVRHGHGRLLGKVGRRDEAIEQLRAAVQLDPEHPEICHDLATALRDGGRIDEVIDYFQRATRLRPSHRQAHVNLARLFLDQARFDDAVKSYGCAADLSPENPRVQAYVAFALLKAGQHEDAKSAALRSLALDANYKPAQRILADIQKIKAVQSNKQQNESNNLERT